MGSSALNIEGSLYELVARGNKDKYFIEDDKESKNIFDNRYVSMTPCIHELRRLPPINSAEFGRSVEFQIEIAGDLFVEPTLLIDLPSWIPPQYSILNPTSIVTDTNGISYGYTNGIGYFLFEKIQILQDNYLLQEFSGQALWALTRGRGSLNQHNLDDKLLGFHDGSKLGIGRNATPNRMRLQLPIFGCQNMNDGGFPLLAINQQSYRVRCFLRKIEDLVESSDGATKPAPWDLPALKIQTSRNGSWTNFTPLTRSGIGSVGLVLETRHIYTDADTQRGLKESSLEIPYERLYENCFTQNANDYASLATGGVATITRRLEGVHPCSGIISFYWSDAVLNANQYWNISNSGSNYYLNAKLIIAGKDRETLFSPIVWNLIVTHSKWKRDSALQFNIMDWSLGDIIQQSEEQPNGTINMSTADRPTFFVQLASVINGAQKTELHSIAVTWASMICEKGRAYLQFAN